MSGIDWDKAPEGANYAAIASDGKLIAWLVDVAEPITGRNVAARPSVVWVGEALPPAGTACEYNASSDHDKGKELWCEVFIKYLSEWVIVFECTKAPAGHEASVGVELFGDISERIEKRFRPIRTPEQIATDERSKECDRIYGILSSVDRPGNKSDMAEAIYDAGMRFTEPAK